MGLREGRFTIRQSHYHSSHRAKGGSLFKLILHLLISRRVRANLPWEDDLGALYVKMCHEPAAHEDEV
jgi:hypothetical protein